MKDLGDVKKTLKLIGSVFPIHFYSITFPRAVGDFFLIKAEQKITKFLDIMHGFLS